jgi:polar amino acid transport system substrate-binding protein
MGKKLIYSLIFAMLIAPICFAEDLTIYTEDAPPLNYLKDGKLTGVSVAIVKELQRRVGHTGQIEVATWAKGYAQALHEPNVALFSTARTNERESLFTWIGKLACKRWVFYKRKGSNIQITSLNDAKKVGIIGTYLNDAKEQFLKSEGFTNISAAPNNTSNMKKLLNARIDLWITSDTEWLYLAKREHFDPTDLEIAYVIKTVDLYLIFSNKTSDEIISKWQQAYQAMVADQTLNAIIAKNNDEN